MKASDRDKLRSCLANLASASHVLVGDSLAIVEWCYVRTFVTILKVITGLTLSKGFGANCMCS